MEEPSSNLSEIKNKISVCYVHFKNNNNLVCFWQTRGVKQSLSKLEYNFSHRFRLYAKEDKSSQDLNVCHYNSGRLLTYNRQYHNGEIEDVPWLCKVV